MIGDRFRAGVYLPALQVVYIRLIVTYRGPPTAILECDVMFEGLIQLACGIYQRVQAANRSIRS